MLKRLLVAVLSIVLLLNSSFVIVADDSDFDNENITENNDYNNDTQEINENIDDIKVIVEEDFVVEEESNISDSNTNDVIITTSQVRTYASSIVKTGKCGENAEYVIYKDKTMVISGYGDMYDYAPDPLNATSTKPIAPWGNYDVRNVTIESGITSIGTYAFCRTYTDVIFSIIIPDTVTSIGVGAFYESNLISITIPDTVTTIGSSAFHECDYLESITIPNSIVSIGSLAFSYCDCLTSLTVPISYHFPYYSDNTAIFKNTNIKTVTVTKGKGTTTEYTETTAKQTPWYGKSLDSITIEEGVTSIGDYMFYGCSANTIIIANSVTEIGWNAFRNTRPHNITMPISAPGINFGNEYGDWDHYSYLDSITLTKGTGGDWGFSSSGAPWSYQNVIQGSKNIILEDGITSIPSQMFRGCGGGEKVFIPSSVKSIGNGAFLNTGLIIYTDAPTKPNGWNKYWNCNKWDIDTGYSSPLNVVYNIDRASIYNQSTINFDCDGGTQVSSITQDIGTTIVKPKNPSKVGYTFLGWDKDMPSIMPANDLTVKALWELDVYNITYDLGGGVNNILNPTSYTYEDDSIVLLNPTKNDHSFVGWYLNKDKITTIPAHSTGDIKLTAKWEINYAYAVLCNDGRFVFFRSYNVYNNESMGTFYDSNNNIYTGTIYTSIESSNYSTKDSIPWNSQADKIKTVKIASNQTITPISTSYWFSNCSNLTNIDLTGLDTSNVTNMKDMFASCPSLKNIDVSMFDTKNVTNMRGVFYGCSSLNALDLSSFNTNKVTDMQYMFSYSTSLTSLDLSMFNTSKVTTTEGMFIGCSNLNYLDLSSFNTNKATSMKKMFDNCSSLNSIKLGKDFKWLNNAYLPTGEWTNDVISYTNVTLYNNWNSSLAGIWKLVTSMTNIPTSVAKANTPISIDGQPIIINSQNMIVMPEDAKVAAVYDTANSSNSDIHTQYPTHMKVYTIEDGQLVHHSSLDDILTYAGASIRFTGVKGIRIITSIPTTKKNQLVNGNIDGYKVMEYGTVMCWASDLSENEEPSLYYDSNSKTFKASHGAKGRAYSRDNNLYTIYSEGGGVTKYTNTLVDSNNTWGSGKCGLDFAMRSYMILRKVGESDSSKDIVIYGGTLYRSIAYVAYQNRNAFTPGSTNYEYIWSLIRAGYGSQYDNEYKGSK